MQGGVPKTYGYSRMKRVSRRRQTKRGRKQRRASTKRSFSRKRSMRGGADLAVPEGSVVGIALDPKDAYSVPILVSKATYENEVLDD